MNSRTIGPGAPSERHDHARCIGDALDAAERICRDRGLRLTVLRRRVLEIVWQDHRPMTAYAILERLVGDGQRAQAPTVYRCLDFLLHNGLVHRVESHNAYVGCNRPASGHAVGFYICEDCGDVAEIADPGVNRSLHRGAARIGFSVTSQVIEVNGVCNACEAKRHG